MRRALLGLFLLMLAAPVAPGLAPAPGLPAASGGGAGPLDFLTGPLVENATRLAYAATGDNITREDVRVLLRMDFRTLDFDTVGVIFGGGDFEAQARLHAHLEFRALSIRHLEGALERAGVEKGEVQNVTGVNLSRQFLTADQFRAALVGEALAAFEAEQEEKAAGFLQETFPDLTVLSTRFAWTNTSPETSLVGDGPGQVRLKDPPIALDVVLDVQYLKRTSLMGILDAFLEKKAEETEADRQAEEAEDALLDRLKSENEGAFYERSAFSLLGLTQLIVLEIDPGWDLEIVLSLPEGYTYEYASPDVTLDPDQRSARTLTFARTAEGPVANPVAVSLSNRFMVSVALLATMLMTGALLRFPTLLVATRLRRRGPPGS